MSRSKLFQPILVGNVNLAHRVVLAPSTRVRASASQAPLPLATFIAPRAGGYKHAPGIWSDEQIAAWKHVTDRVHAKGSYMYLQLWALGRTADVQVLAEAGVPCVSASDVPIKGRTAPRPLTVEEIQEYVQLYATATSNAVHKAGFDGVEIHAANGYLLDQFLHDRSNIRPDAYGGSVENRVRFPLEVVDAVVEAVGQKRSGMRLSPWGTFNDMHFDDPMPTYAHLVTELRERYPALAYLHVVEPRVDGSVTVEVKEGYSNDFIRDIWEDRPLISAGGYTRETAIATADHKGDLIAFSRLYIANPDLAYRLFYDIALAVGNRALYYAPGSSDPKGYTDYPFAGPVGEVHWH
ncbi:hypothetical protein GGX14DRAFT_535313 [Mycena pura]|uniref:NADH:flavin oxidoreductase/NADH oxidase N-terminal domain-containing protein n=1 Tax=Mycena pura TaxID=153505 RepID=A0AAD6YBN2_9AGAR|nr:hypothetical protein GGX14DRAFT_535313 [Mycena pura]